MGLTVQSKRANFDATHELEELLLEENPLKARKRKEGQELEMMSPEMRMMEEQYVSLSLSSDWGHLTPRSRHSFKVFDHSRAQRRSYYHPAGNPQTTSSGTQATSSTAVSASQSPRAGAGSPAAKSVGAGAGTGQGPPDMRSLALPAMPKTSRPTTPSDRTGVVSKSGYDIEAQILDGGGMANMGGRGGWRSGSDDEGSVRGLEVGASPVAQGRRTAEREREREGSEVLDGHAGGQVHGQGQGQGQGLGNARGPSPLRASST